MKDCRAVHEVLAKYNITYLFGGEDTDYCIGTTRGREQELIDHMKTFHPNMTEEEIRESDLFQFMMKHTKVVPSFEALEADNARIIKIFAVSNDLELLGQVDAELQKNPNLAVAASFENNLEVTDRNAQKGIALKNYIESLGYSMDEVMVFGDSMNDYSMISMDFGATIAMENGMQKIKDVAKYTTKSNIEDGVAYVVEELLKRQSDWAN